jgi:hypothetical protein
VLIDKALHIVASASMVIIGKEIGVKSVLPVLGIGMGKEIYDIMNVSSAGECAMDLAADIIGIGIGVLIMRLLTDT